MEIEPCLQQGKRSPKRRQPGPDGREAWCVAFAALFINFVMAGLARMAGVLYREFIDVFDTDRMHASLPFSVRSSTRNLCGPVVGILGQKYGVRSVTLVGSILGTLSAASCFYATDITWLTVLWGVFNGIGAALTTTLSQVTIGQHFQKYRSTAVGMSFSGGCIGAFVFPVLLEYLLYTYHLQGTFLIIGGILMQVIPAAMLLKKPSWLTENKPRIEITPANIDSSSSVDGIRMPNGKDKYGKSDVNVNDVISSKISYSSSKDKITEKLDAACNQCNSSRNDRTLNEEFLWQNRKLVIRLLTDDFTLSLPPESRKESFNKNIFVEEIEELFRQIVIDAKANGKVLKDFPMDLIDRNRDRHEEKDPHLKIFISPNQSLNPHLDAIMNSNLVNCLSFYLDNLFERDRNDIIQYFSEGEHEHISLVLEELWIIYVILKENKRNMFLNSTSSLFMDCELINFEESVEHPNTFCSHIKTAINLYTKPLFLLICLCRAMHFLTFVSIVTTVVDFSMDKGLLEEDGKYIIAALSAGDLLGRLCLGWITDRAYISLPRYMLIVMVLQGASTVCLAFVYSKAALMTAIAIFGLLQGTVFVRHPVLISRYLGSHEQSIAMGCINFFSGILAFTLPSYIGYFRDTLGSYDGIFYVNGTAGAIIGLLWLFEPYLLKLSKSRAKRNQQAPV